MDTGNLFKKLRHSCADEVIQELARGGEFTLQRIVSTGQTTPAGKWYDQESEEWVVLLSGSARVRFEARDELSELRPGDYVRIPAHCRHRVEWTSPDEETVWLALHFLRSDLISVE